MILQCASHCVPCCFFLYSLHFDSDFVDFRLRLGYSMQVSSPLISLAIPRSCSHILAGLLDGELVILTVAPNISDVMMAAR